MIEIMPAVLPHDFKDLESHVQRLQGAAITCVQIDAVDGHFAHNRTWPYRDEGTFQKIVQEERGLPLWERLDFEFDLMVQKPLEHIMDFVHAGASRMLVHASSEDAPQAIQKLVDLREETGAFSVMAGVALACDAQPDALLPFEAQFDYV
ncbi:MAG TPA: hypothetical protein VIJ88_00850, partial [Candidatus Paceibacterota bacterium]